MPSRDYLIRQFEEMGFFLASLIKRILKMKAENQLEQMESAVREELIQALKLDIGQIVMLKNQEFLSLIQTTFSSDDQVEKLADILKILGQEIGHSFTLTKANYLRKSLFLFEHLQNSSANFSYDRKLKIEELSEILRIQGIDL